MNRFALVLLLPLLIGQTGVTIGPLVYCLEEGELCCLGPMGTEACCDEEPAQDPGLCSAGACADVEADAWNALTARGSRWFPSPESAPASILVPASQAPDPPHPVAARNLPASGFHDPHRATTVLRR